MIFMKNQVPQAIRLPFNWVADYFDGTYLSEYDLLSHQGNSFYSIKQNETVRFGLFGQGIKFYFENSDGSFYLNGKRVEVMYEVDGKQYHLTTNFNRKDFITYKQAYTNYSSGQGVQKSNIESINFGYKTNYKNEDVEFNFQPVVSLQFGKSAYMEIKLTCNQSLDGELIFKSSGRELERFHAPLEAGVSGQMNWTIK
ncbi:hypothetical protein [Psychrobacillus phage Perkons]|nr:hypothetical protein [Psychrobacillus phage Perkons]